MPQGLLPGLQPAAAHLRVWPGSSGSRGIDAPQQIAVLEPRLEGGPVQGPCGLIAVLPMLPAPAASGLSSGPRSGAKDSDGNCLYVLVVLEQKDGLGEAAQTQNA